MRPDRHTRRRTVAPASLVLVALFAGGVLLGGCPDKKKRPPRPATLVVHADAEPPHLVNMIQPDAWAHRITSHNLFESLIRMDPSTYRFEPELASTHKASEDGLTYTFYLRQGVKWHDGRAFSGEDVLFTFDRLMDEKVRAVSARATLAPFISDYELQAPDRFVITCKKPSPWFLMNLSDLAILPAHIFGKGDLNEHPRLRSPVGTGPYKLGSWRSGDRLVLERFDGYWGEEPRIARVVYRFIPSPDLAVKLARRREIDFLPRIRAAHWVGQVRRDPVFRHEFVTTRHYPPGTSYILVNHRRPLFQDRRVRRALALLLDTRTIVDKILHGLGQPVGSLYWFKDPHYNRAIKPPAYAPARARKLLAEAGFRDTDDNGVLDRDGEPFRFTFLVVASSKSQKRWITIYQQALKKAGIVMDINPLDWSAYLGRLRAHDFDMGALAMLQSGPFTDLYYQLHSSQIDDGQNYGAYRNTEVDQLLEQIRSEMDRNKRQRLSHELQKILADDMAMIPLFAVEDPGVVARRVHGVYTSALWYQIRDWWIDRP